MKNYTLGDRDMLEEIFGGCETPKEDVYRAAQKVIKSYMDSMNKKIDYVARELGTTEGYLRKQLDPNQPEKPLSIDRIIDITRLTKDTRIIEEVAHEVDMLAVSNVHTTISILDIHHLTDIANMEGSDVFREVKSDLEDGKIDENEKSQILKEIREAKAAYQKLEDTVMALMPKDEE